MSALSGFPRPIEEINRQLADLLKVKGAAEAYGTKDAASAMGMDSILLHERDLREELRAAEMITSGADIEVVLDGDPVKDHTIHAGFLGAFLTRLQSLTNATAQAITSEPTARGPIRRNIIAENKLQVTGWVPSSFAVRLRLPTKEDLGQLEEPASGEVLDALDDLLSPENPSGNTIELVLQPRIKEHFSGLMDLIAKHGAEMGFRTKRKPFAVRIKAEKARERLDWLDLLQTEEKVIPLEGVLVGGSIETKRFELKVDDEIYRGKVSDSTQEEMKSLHFGDIVRAKVRRTTTVHEEGAMEPGISYYLLGFEDPHAKPLPFDRK